MREFLPDFGIYATVDECTDERTGQYLIGVFERRRKCLLSPTARDSTKKFLGIIKGPKPEK